MKASHGDRSFEFKGTPQQRLKRNNCKPTPLQSWSSGANNALSPISIDEGSFELPSRVLDDSSIENILGVAGVSTPIAGDRSGGCCDVQTVPVRRAHSVDVTPAPAVSNTPEATDISTIDEGSFLFRSDDLHESTMEASVLPSPIAAPVPAQATECNLPNQRPDRIRDESVDQQCGGADWSVIEFPSTPHPRVPYNELPSDVSIDGGTPFWDKIRKHAAVTCFAGNHHSEADRSHLPFTARWHLEKIFLPPTTIPLHDERVDGRTENSMQCDSSTVQTLLRSHQQRLDAFLDTRLGRSCLREVSSFRGSVAELSEADLVLRLRMLDCAHRFGGVDAQQSSSINPQAEYYRSLVAMTQSTDSCNTRSTSKSRQFEACLDVDTGAVTLNGPISKDDHCSTRAYREFGDHRFLVLRYCERMKRGSNRDGKSFPNTSCAQTLVRTGFVLCGRTYKWLCNKHQVDGSTTVTSSSGRRRLPLVSIMFATAGVGDNVNALAEIPIETVRKWHIDLSVAGNVSMTAAKYNARFQLAFSRTAAVPLPTNTSVVKVPDALWGQNKFLMTDGAAPISADLMQYIATKLDWATTPCAFQGRIGGCKGVWYMVPSFEEADFHEMRSNIQHLWGSQPMGRLWIAIRQSMTKIDYDWDRATTTQLEIEVCAAHAQKHRTKHVDHPDRSASLVPETVPVTSPAAVCKFDAATLNRQLLLVLASRGVANSIILRKLEMAIDNIDCATRLTTSNSTSTARQLALQEVLSWAATKAAIPRWLSTHQVLAAPSRARELSSSSWWERARHIFRESWMSTLETKMKVPIPKSKRLLMLPDPCSDFVGQGAKFRQLQPGEVFVHIAGLGILEGTVVLARNPCHSPRDLLKCKAVDPYLSSDLKSDSEPWFHLRKCLIDVVVFPVIGTDAEGSASRRLSGGDFDGDCCWVCWDEDIVDAVTCAHPSAEATEPSEPEAADPKTFMASSIVGRHGCHESGIPSSATLEKLFLHLANSTQTSQLGQLCNLHEQWADFLAPDGGCAHSYCLELADICAKAVDAAKTGMMTQVPAWAHVKKLRTPHWKAKIPLEQIAQQRNVRRSHSILGAVFDTVTQYDAKYRRQRTVASGVNRTETLFRLSIDAMDDIVGQANAIHLVQTALEHLVQYHELFRAVLKWKEDRPGPLRNLVAASSDCKAVLSRIQLVFENSGRCLFHDEPYDVSRELSALAFLRALAIFESNVRSARLFDVRCWAVTELVMNIVDPAFLEKLWRSSRGREQEDKCSSPLSPVATSE